MADDGAAGGRSGGTGGGAAAGSAGVGGEAGVGEVLGVVVRVVAQTPRDRRLVLAPACGTDVFAPFRPGQHVVLRLPGPGPRAAAPLSLAGDPTAADGVLEVTVRLAGAFGSRVGTLAPGAVVGLTGPGPGPFFDVDPGPSAPALLLAGGSGVAPFRALLFALRARRHAAPVTLVLSARRPDELLFHEEWARVAAEHPWFSYLATVTRPTGVGWAGRTGRIGSGWVRALLPDPASCVVAACGPTGFVEAACAFAREAGVPADRVRRERWG